MFLPKSKYTIEQAVVGQYVLSASQDSGFYVGPYIKDFRGRCFAGTSLLGAEKRELIAVMNEDEVKPVQVKVDIIPTEEQYLSGSVMRYFRQNPTSKVVEEIDEEKLKKSENWIVTSGSWILTGSLDDVKMYGITYRGVRWRNLQTMKKWEKDIRGITEALNLHPEDLVRN